MGGVGRKKVESESAKNQRPAAAECKKSLKQRASRGGEKEMFLFFFFLVFEGPPPSFPRILEKYLLSAAARAAAAGAQPGVPRNSVDHQGIATEERPDRGGNLLRSRGSTNSPAPLSYPYFIACVCATGLCDCARTVMRPCFDWPRLIDLGGWIHFPMGLWSQRLKLGLSYS